MKSYTLRYVTFLFSLSSSTFSIYFFFLEDFVSQIHWFPMFKDKYWHPNTHHKFVFVLCNKAQPSGEICFCITKEKTSNNSNCTWTNFSSNSKNKKEDTKNNSNCTWTNLSSNYNKKIQTIITISLGQICLPIPRRYKQQLQLQLQFEKFVFQFHVDTRRYKQQFQLHLDKCVFQFQEDTRYKQ
jgi:hypothetical protein